MLKYAVFSDGIAGGDKFSFATACAGFNQLIEFKQSHTGSLTDMDEGRLSTCEYHAQIISDRAESRCICRDKSFPDIE